MGAEGELLEYCIRYGRISLLTMGPFMMQYAFQSLFVTAEKPHLGFVFTVCAGVCNMVLDALFILGFEWGIEGAALATGISELFGGLAPCFYFYRKNSSLLHFAKPVFDLTSIRKAVTNGMSEFVSSISMSIVGILYNIQLLKYAGEDGVAAYGVLMYVNFIFIAIFIGYSMSTAPVIGYHYGAQNHSELKNLLRRSLVLTASFAVILFGASQLLAGTFAEIFVGYDAELKEMTIQAFRIYTVSFLLCGFNIFGSSFFTALNNGVISAVISFMRTLIFEVGAILLLPMLFGLTGIWSAIIVAEIAALILTAFFIVKKRHVYHY
jgi:Na+-driven multidrug efflux pump